MARSKGNKTPLVLEGEALKELFSKTKEINSTKGISEFLDLVFTNEEKRLILRRIVISRLLREGKSYSNIIKHLKVSSNTISNVRDILESRGYGRNPNRKRVYGSSYSILKKKDKEEKLFRKYKGSESII